MKEVRDLVAEEHEKNKMMVDDRYYEQVCKEKIETIILIEKTNESLYTLGCTATTITGAAATTALTAAVASGWALAE